MSKPFSTDKRRLDPVVGPVVARPRRGDPVVADPKRRLDPVVADPVVADPVVRPSCPLADEYITIRPDGGRFFINDEGAYFHEEHSNQVQFGTFRFGKVLGLAWIS